MLASLRCRPPGCGRARREGSIEELDIERDVGATVYPSDLSAKDRPSMTCGLGPVCRFSAPSFGEELLNPGDTVPYQATNSASLQPKIAHPTFAASATPYIELEGEESLESPGHEAEKLVQDLAHVKQSVGYLNKLVTLLTIVALLSTTGLLTLLYSNLSLPNQILAKRYALLATIPIVALLFTWFHIWLAIQMMFLPVEFFGLWQYQSSGMGIGWQGLVPRKCEKMARMSYKCARPFLEGPRDWLSRVDPKRLVSEVRSELRVVIDNAMAHVLKKYLPRTDNRMPSSIRTSMTEQALDKIQETAPELWKNFTNLLCNDEFGIDNDGMIVKVFTENKELLNF
ncbi:unnamed protein product [Cladocopium goreaui]|uniref:Pyrimidine-specific ribonucleoside hydrolase RihA n=1 Tax=Cladocopium goreaui TaxID=2562237 RepID=A0A9P1G1L3_9DINO|nr:unnamed protein product [Cladocopium goreaui]